LISLKAKEKRKNFSIYLFIWGKFYSVNSKGGGYRGIDTKAPHDISWQPNWHKGKYTK